MDYGFYGFKIHNPWILKWIWNGLPKSLIHMDYGFFMDFQYKSVGIMDFLWNGYRFRILMNMDYGMDMDLVLNPSEPTAHIPHL